jgi:hypothetical protein
MALFLLENRNFLGFRMIFKVWLNQIFSNFNTMLWTIKCRLNSITVYFTFTVHKLWPFSAHLAFRPCELLSSLFVRRPSVNISHFNLLLRNQWANCNQTLVEWSLDGPLPKLCPVIPTSNQDGRQAKNRKKGG